MKKLWIVAEANLSDKDAIKIISEGKICWDKNRVIATICDKPLKFVRAGIKHNSDYGSYWKEV